MGAQRDEHYVPKCGDRVEVFALVGAPQLNGRYALFGLRRVLWLCAHSEASNLRCHGTGPLGSQCGRLGVLLSLHVRAHAIIRIQTVQDTRQDQGTPTLEYSPCGAASGCLSSG